VSTKAFGGLGMSDAYSCSLDLDLAVVDLGTEYGPTHFQQARKVLP
jgi:hypothetical protein